MVAELEHDPVFAVASHQHALALGFLGDQTTNSSLGPTLNRARRPTFFANGTRAIRASTRLPPSSARYRDLLRVGGAKGAVSPNPRTRRGRLCHPGRSAV